MRINYIRQIKLIPRPQSAAAHWANPSRLAITGLCLTVIGLLGVVPTIFSDSNPVLAAPASAATQATTPAANVAAPVNSPLAETPAPQAISGHPVRILIPSVGIDLPVVDGFYDPQTSSWTLYADKAQFASKTSQPNDNSGQTFIYGHATWQVFGKLLDMKIGNEAYVSTSNGYKFTYTLKETQVVSPDSTNMLDYDGKPRLLLQTCVGTFSENRKFFILDYTKVDKL
jgi:LPXTG-site transpeptidase (sortase) family protein